MGSYVVQMVNLIFCFLVVGFWITFVSPWCDLHGWLGVNNRLPLLLRSYDHALDPESGSVDEVGGRQQVFCGAPQSLSASVVQLGQCWILLLRAWGRTVHRTCSGVCGLVSHGQLSMCDRRSRTNYLFIYGLGRRGGSIGRAWTRDPKDRCSNPVRSTIK